MKKILAIVLFGILLLSGCSPIQNKNNNSTSNLDISTSNSYIDLSSENDELVEGFEKPEYDKFNSYASENGLGGTYIYVEGKAIELTLTEAAVGVIIQENDGNKWVVGFPSYNGFGYDAQENLVNRLIDSEIRVFGQYDGFSRKVNLPFIALVANDEDYDYIDKVRIESENKDGEYETVWSYEEYKNEVIWEFALFDNETNCEENTSDDQNQLNDEQNEFNTGNYAYITNEDLDKYASNIEGVKIYVVTEVNDIKDGLIQSILTDGYMMSSFDVGDKYSKYESLIREDDTVAIAGTVGEIHDYSLFGKSVDINDCIVFAIGNEAETYRKAATDDSLSQYLTVNEEVANLNGDSITGDEYKSLCNYLDYEDILRNPDSYDGKYCVISGTVDQIIEGWFDSYTIYLVDSDGNKWQCWYSYEEGESHLLEGDNITVYGECNGTDTAETLIGEQVTMPDIDVEYID